jgi:uncharacterized DUF497 family protein
MGRPLASFDWDNANRAKCQKHGVSIDEIEALFRGTPKIAPDRKHSEREGRFLAVGRNSMGRPIFVVFTLREEGGRTHIRPISARYMHRKEVERYEKESTGFQDR